VRQIPISALTVSLNIFWSAIANVDGFAVDAKTGVITIVDGTLAAAPVSVLAVLAKNDGPIRAGNYDMATVTVRNFLNQSLLMFDEMSYSQSVLENASIASRILQVSATLYNYAATATVTYTISSGNIGASFMIDSISGWISVAKKLNRSVSVYNLTLQATANTVPLLSGAISSCYFE